MPLPPDTVTVAEYTRCRPWRCAGALCVTVSAAPQVSVNAAAFDVTLPGLVMTIEPDPLALSLAGL